MTVFSLDTLLEQAHERSEDDGLPYAGAFLPSEAFELLRLNPEAVLVDVRTRAERDWVGFIPGSLHIEWNVYPSMASNPAFLEALETANVTAEQPVLFICRSGGRSHSAAALVAANGYTSAYNVLEGFEGDKDINQQRSTINGWKKSNLPWIQS